jgi:hypothetical protein
MPRKRVAGLQQGHEHRLVGLRARVRLDVGVAGAEQLLGPLDGERLDLVDEFAAAVVALARIALGVLVGQDRALGLQHRLGDDVFRCDQFDLVLLTTQLQTDPIEDVAVRRGEVRAEEGGQVEAGAVMGRSPSAAGSQVAPSLTGYAPRSMTEPSQSCAFVPFRTAEPPAT